MAPHDLWAGIGVDPVGGVQRPQLGLAFEHGQHVTKAEGPAATVVETLVQRPDKPQVSGIVDRPALAPEIPLSLEQHYAKALGPLRDEWGDMLALMGIGSLAPG